MLCEISLRYVKLKFEGLVFLHFDINFQQKLNDEVNLLN